MQASGCLLQVNVLELSRFSWLGVGNHHIGIGLGLMMGKKLYLKLTLGMAERRYTESPPDEESMGRELVV